MLAEEIGGAMASSLDYVTYVCDQLNGAGEITYKRMFGEYGIYLNGKMFGCICDDQFFVKKTEAGSSFFPDCEEGAPYTGAKLHMVIDEIDDRDLMARFVLATCEELPVPKPRKKKAAEK